MELFAQESIQKHDTLVKKIRKEVISKRLAKRAENQWLVNSSLTYGSYKILDILCTDLRVKIFVKFLTQNFSVFIDCAERRQGFFLQSPPPQTAK